MKLYRKELTTKPAQLLQRLDERLQEALRQKQSNNMDGMDVALCSIKKVDTIHHSTGKKQFQVTFAGAKRPLYCIKDDVFEEIKGNRMSVGGITKKKERSDLEFTEQKIILSKGDNIYLTTDGFADQNGSNQQKVGSKKTQRIIRRVSFTSFCRTEEEIRRLFRHSSRQTKTAR